MTGGKKGKAGKAFSNWWDATDRARAKPSKRADALANKLLWEWLCGGARKKERQAQATLRSLARA
jgi:hypothetical protein